MTKGKWKYCKQITAHAFGDYQPAEFIYEIFEGEKCIGHFKDEINAKRIVQAVNSFPDLLEVCKSMERHFKYAINDEDDKIAYLKLKEAIAQAETK